MSPVREADASAFARHEGTAVLTTGQALVKGVLECSAHVATLTISRSETTRGLVSRLQLEAEQALLQRHRLSLQLADDATRAVRLGRWAVGQGGLHVVIAGGRSSPELWLGDLPAALPEGGAMAIACETAPGARRACLDAGLPVLEPTDPADARDAVESALRISRASSRVVLILIGSRLMRSAASIVLRPNHGQDELRREGRPRARHRVLRWDRSEPPLRIARRLELNTHRELPNPGEIAPVGLVTIGRSDQVVRRLFDTTDTKLRVPVLHLGLSSPLDDAAALRLLDRCASVIVVEPGDGVVTDALRAIADARRREGTKAAPIDHLPAPETVDRLAAVLQPWLQLPQSVDHSPLPDPPETGGLTIGAAAMLQVVVERLRTVLLHWGKGKEDVRIELDGKALVDVHGEVCRVETWTGRDFRRAGAGAVRQAIGSRAHWIHVIAAGAPPRGAALERLAAAYVPPDLDDVPSVLRVPFNDERAMTRALQDALEGGGVTVLVIGDTEARWDVEVRERRATDMDQTGFRPLQRVVQPVERFCSPHLYTSRQWAADTLHPELHGSMDVDRLDGDWRFRLALRVRPLLEAIEVSRARAPRVTGGGRQLPVPVPRHAQAPSWYVHLAGIRGRPPGIAGDVLALAGNAMGYQVDWQSDLTPIGPGRRAWTQLRFEQPPASGTAAIERGSADLLIGIDAKEAIDAAARRRLCDPLRTFVVLAGEEADATLAWFRGVWPDKLLLIADVEETCRRRFHTDRLTDMVLLGAAFQRGWIPLTVDVMQAALNQLEHEGVARLQEAFAYGRQGAIDEALLSPERSADPLDTPVRRARRWGLLARSARRRSARSLGALLDRVLSGLPGLAETLDGRAMRGVLVDGLAAVTTWGGIDAAQKLADDVLSLYRVDRGDAGRPLTRAAIGPLVLTTLMRDPIYVARMAVSSGHRAALRRSLDVRPGRGDIMEIRYLTRIEAIFGTRRLRIQVRTSDWVARLVATLGTLVPLGWRGSRRQRSRRNSVRSLVHLATQQAQQGDEAWNAARAMLEALRRALDDGTLESMSSDDIMALTDPQQPVSCS
jgi:Pyruvate/2-oxoacid:ferredoxin oxidoreductase gamma subunit